MFTSIEGTQCRNSLPFFDSVVGNVLKWPKYQSPDLSPAEQVVHLPKLLKHPRKHDVGLAEDHGEKCLLISSTPSNECLVRT